jgi:TPR repeat protein
LRIQKELRLKQYAEAAERRIKVEKAQAQDGNASAQYMLGRRYLYGDGVAKDEAAALRLLEQSASQGNADAKALLRSVESLKQTFDTTKNQP